MSSEETNASKYSLLVCEDQDVMPSSSRAQRESTYRASFPLWSILGCVLCTIINVFILRDSLQRRVCQSDLPRQTAPLPRPNKYIGLDTVNRTGTKTPKPLVNYPPILTQISSTDKDHVFPDEPRRWFSPVGTVSPDDRHFLVSKDIHTVAQFRVHDFGMESCEVVINVPPTSTLDAVPRLLKGVAGNKSVLSLHPNRVPVQVWKLDTEIGIDVRKLSWNTRPLRHELVATLYVEEGKTTATHQFYCKSDSLQTFEFSCVGDKPCLVDFWQDKQDPMIAAILLQHSTVN